MTKYLIDFDTMTPGAAPTGMTRRWVTAGDNWSVVDNAHADGTSNGLVSPASWTATARRALSFDFLDSDAQRDVVEIYSEFKGGANADARFFLKASGGAGTENGFTAGTYGVSNILRVHKYVSATSTDLDTAAFTVVPNQWYSQRIRMDKGTGAQTIIRVKVWVRGEAEPETYQRNFNATASTDVSAPLGWFGLINFAANSVVTWGRYIGVATNGDAAPMTPADMPVAVAQPRKWLTGGGWVDMPRTLIV